MKKMRPYDIDYQLVRWAMDGMPWTSSTGSGTLSQMARKAEALRATCPRQRARKGARAKQEKMTLRWRADALEIQAKVHFRDLLTQALSSE
jgi:hypothetical protein